MIDHGLPKTQEFSMETATTIIMWTSIVAFLTMNVTLSLVTYNVFQLFEPDDVTCTLDEYSQLQWVTVPTSLAKQLPETLLYKESADSPVTKGTAVIPETQKTTCAEKLHHASPENPQLSGQRRQLPATVRVCNTLTTGTINFTTTPIATILYETSYPAQASFETTYGGAVELSFPNNEYVCTVPNTLVFKRLITFMYYSMDSETRDVTSGELTSDSMDFENGDMTSGDRTSSDQFSTGTPYLGFFTDDNTLVAYMQFNDFTQNEFSPIWSVSDKSDHIYLFKDTGFDVFKPSFYQSSYKMTDRASTIQKVIALNSEIGSVDNTGVTTWHLAQNVAPIVVRSLNRQSYVIF
jgi:hypothetical protein